MGVKIDLVGIRDGSRAPSSAGIGHSYKHPSVRSILFNTIKWPKRHEAKAMSASMLARVLEVFGLGTFDAANLTNYLLANKYNYRRINGEFVFLIGFKRDEHKSCINWAIAQVNEIETETKREPVNRETEKRIREFVGDI